MLDRWHRWAQFEWECHHYLYLISSSSSSSGEYFPMPDKWFDGWMDDWNGTGWLMAKNHPNQWSRLINWPLCVRCSAVAV